MAAFPGRRDLVDGLLILPLWVSYRNREKIMGERGVPVDHSTVYRRVQKFAWEIEKRLRWHWRRPQSTSWRVDKTHVKVRGKWTYLYRALDKFGNTIDFYLSPTGDAKGAKRFFGKAFHGLKDWEKLAVINTDKADGKCPKEIVHRQVKYLNNGVEADRGKLKQSIRFVGGFKTLKTAYATIKGSRRCGRSRASSPSRAVCNRHYRNLGAAWWLFAAFFLPSLAALVAGLALRRKLERDPA